MGVAMKIREEDGGGVVGTVVVYGRMAMTLGGRVR
jgi:hypothetical protein